MRGKKQMSRKKERCHYAYPIVCYKLSYVRLQIAYSLRGDGIVTRLILAPHSNTICTTVSMINIDTNAARTHFFILVCNDYNDS